VSAGLAGKKRHEDSGRGASHLTRCYMGSGKLRCDLEDWRQFLTQKDRKFCYRAWEVLEIDQRRRAIVLKESHSTSSLHSNTGSIQFAKSQEFYLHLFNHLLQSELAIAIFDIAISSWSNETAAGPVEK